MEFKVNRVEAKNGHSKVNFDTSIPIASAHLLTIPSYLDHCFHFSLLRSIICLMKLHLCKLSHKNFPNTPNQFFNLFFVFPGTEIRSFNVHFIPGIFSSFLITVHFVQCIHFHCWYFCANEVMLALVQP